jgi:hypothetical protein
MPFWGEEESAAVGYTDGWSDEGIFYFTGTGQSGDQDFGGLTSENGRVRDHKAKGDRLRLLKKTGKNQVEYSGEFELADPPWVPGLGVDKEGAPRQVIQFRLRPLSASQSDEASAIRDRFPGRLEEFDIPNADVIETERPGIDDFDCLLPSRAVKARRREARLVQDFKDWAFESHSLAVKRLRLPLVSERSSLWTDAYIQSTGTLIEAKASSRHEFVRVALGQLLDYARFVNEKPVQALGVLLPTRPTDDLLALGAWLADRPLYSFGFIWREGKGFTSEPNGFFSVEVR